MSCNCAVWEKPRGFTSSAATVGGTAQRGSRSSPLQSAFDLRKVCRALFFCRLIWLVSVFFILQSAAFRQQKAEKPNGTGAKWSQMPTSEKTPQKAGDARFFSRFLDLVVWLRDVWRLPRKKGRDKHGSNFGARRWQAGVTLLRRGRLQQATHSSAVSPQLTHTPLHTIRNTLSLSFPDREIPFCKACQTLHAESRLHTLSFFRKEWEQQHRVALETTILHAAAAPRSRAAAVRATCQETHETAGEANGHWRPPNAGHGQPFPLCSRRTGVDTPSDRLHTIPYFKPVRPCVFLTARVGLSPSNSQLFSARCGEILRLAMGGTAPRPMRLSHHEPLPPRRAALHCPLATTSRIPDRLGRVSTPS